MRWRCAASTARGCTSLTCCRPASRTCPGNTLTLTVTMTPTLLNPHLIPTLACCRPASRTCTGSYLMPGSQYRPAQTPHAGLHCVFRLQRTAPTNGRCWDALPQTRIVTVVKQCSCCLCEVLTCLWHLQCQLENCAGSRRHLQRATRGGSYWMRCRRNSWAWASASGTSPASPQRELCGLILRRCPVMLSALRWAHLCLQQCCSRRLSKVGC